MDKRQLTRQNLGRVFNFKCDHLQAAHFLRFQVKVPYLKLETLPLDIALPAVSHELFKPLL